MPPQKASLRIAERSIKKYASDYLPSSKMKRIESMLKKNANVWKAVRSMYNVKEGNTSSRNVVSPYFRPKVRKYNATKNRFLNGRSANRAINRAATNRSLLNMLVPLQGAQRGGVHSGYVLNAKKHANIKYALVNENGRLKSFALVKNSPNSRYINVISAFTSYGHPMMNKIISNARTSGKNRVNLKAVIQTNTPNNDPLVKWYMSKGFKKSGNMNSEHLLPMSLVFNR
jgi:hypothetical protein